MNITLKNGKIEESLSDLKDGDYTIVSCEGVIIANYGNEVLEINLADQNYLSIFEGGEWRMCGYR